jgi:hypothetical protein
VLVVAVLVLQVGLDVYVRLRRPDPEDAHTLLRF